MSEKFNLFEALEKTYDEVSYNKFYRDIFPVGSFEEKGVYETGRYNGIAVAIKPNSRKTERYTVTDDLSVIDDLVSTDNFCIMSPISYAGKSRKSSNARYLYALAIDLDGVDSRQRWDFFIHQITHGHEMLSFIWGLPCPTYIVASGTGLHLYYVFEKPIPLFGNVVKELEKLRNRIVWQAWTQGASSLHDSVQYESLFQGFRMVGTITKNGLRARAFKTGEKITVEYLNEYVPSEYRAKDFTYKSDLTLDKAREKYPEWYDKRIVQGQPKGSWKCKKDLYYWWIRTLKGGAAEGHRYWCIMTLAAYAIKAGVSFEELEKDAYDLIPFMNSIGKTPFTEDDVLHALEAYNDSYITYPIDTIVQRTDIPIQKNKRNYRKQNQHLQLARGIRQIKGNMGEIVSGGGRPLKKEAVKEWRSAHPNGTKAECNRDTKLDPKTIRKWWNV